MPPRRNLGLTLELATFLAVAMVAVARAPGSTGWLDEGGVVAAAQLRPGEGQGAVATVLDALASLIPFGELAFRIAVLNAVALAAAAAGVVALARALVPTAAGAGVIGAALLATSPAADGGGAVATALTVWTLAMIVQARRSERGLGRVSRQALVVAAAVLAAGLVPLVMRGDVPGVWAFVAGRDRGGGAALVRTMIDGTGAVLLFAGLVGLGLGALTGLRGAGAVLATALVAAVALAMLSLGSMALVPLALVAAGVAPLAGAIARLGPATQRATIATIAAIPVAAIAAGAPRRAPAADDAGDGVARVAADVMGAVSAGPGAFVATEPAIRGALRHERVVTGLRPDLALVSLGERAVALALRDRQLVASDRPSFGGFDPRRSRLVGRGFELLTEAAPDERAAAQPDGPARYPGAGGKGVAGLLATERARREATRGALDRAAHAAGLAGTRFDAGDLALLAATIQLSPERPPLHGFIPSITVSALPPPWLPELFGDDLAWVSGIDEPPLPAGAPAERRLHALWREVLRGTRPPDDAAILAHGVVAGRATARMLADLGRADLAIAAAEATLARDRADAPTLLVLGSIHADRGRLGDSVPLDEPRAASLAAAENALGRAVAADPHLVDARVLLGLVQARQGKVVDARRTWERGLELAPGHPELLELLGKSRGPR